MTKYHETHKNTKTECIYSTKYSLPKPKTIKSLLNRLKNVHKLKIDLKQSDWNESIIRNVNYNELKNYALCASLITKNTINLKKYKYKSGVSLNDIYNLYLFDIKLKNILIYSIGIIEKNLRTTISNVLSVELSDTECNNFKIYSISPEKTQQTFDSVKNRILSNYKSGQLHDQEIISYIEDLSGHFPIWNLVESFTFGELYYFFKCLNNPIKLEIVKKYGVDIRRFENWIAAMKFVRNICSHFNRLLGKRLNDLCSDAALGIDNSNRTSLISFIKMTCFFLKKCDKRQYKFVVARLDTLFKKNAPIMKQLGIKSRNWNR